MLPSCGLWAFGVPENAIRTVRHLIYLHALPARMWLFDGTTPAQELSCSANPRSSSRAGACPHRPYRDWTRAIGTISGLVSAPIGHTKVWTRAIAVISINHCSAIEKTCSSAEPAAQRRGWGRPRIDSKTEGSSTLHSGRTSRKARLSLIERDNAVLPALCGSHSWQVYCLTLFTARRILAASH